MIVVTLTDCPPRLRGDMSKWLVEINTGVYVGNLSARVRDELWDRICENLRTGRATMVFSAEGEQHMDFRVHNTAWEPVDFDGLKLMRRPAPARMAIQSSAGVKLGYSKAAAFQKARACRSPKHGAAAMDCVVFDLETTGLDPIKDRIIEFGALRIRGGAPSVELSLAVNVNVPLSAEITKLTGLTDDYLKHNGMALNKALADFLDFLGDDTVVCHNAPFDCRFLLHACQLCGRKMFTNRCIDTLQLSRKHLNSLTNYSLSTVAGYFLLNTEGAHRALADCHLTYGIYAKLNELQLRRE